jgi:NAD(P)-dependent dehydrogenase (short-subunit alcohol dehydrogenase family)
MRHRGKTAIITGAAQGIGLACAQTLHREGARVLLVDINETKLREAAEAMGERAAWRCEDLSAPTRAQANAIVADATGRFGSVDILVSNAGIIHLAEFTEFPEDMFDKVLSLNLKAGLVLGQAAARAMIDAGSGGAIVNMSSINALLAIPNSVAYAVSKGGLKQLTAVMSVALAPHGIRVNAVGPGTILTDMVKQSVMASDTQRRTILARTPLGRCGEPSEVASVVSFLASEEASYVTGQTIYPDGGRLVLNYTVPVAD